MSASPLKISVVVPVHNGAHFIAGCVESILAQTFPACEILVVDDGSTDGTGAVLEAFGGRVRVIAQPQKGRSAARNAGIEAAQGDYVAFLDADDRFLPSHLEQLSVGSDNGRHDIVYDWVGTPYCPPGCRVPRKPEGRSAWKHIRKYQLWVVTSMVKREFLARTAIRFPAGMEIGEDALFFWRLILAGASVRYVRARGCDIGVHDANTTRAPQRGAAEPYDRLEQEMRQGACPASARIRGAIRCGRNHDALMALLARLYLDGPATGEPYLRALLRHAAQPCVLPSDRARALLAAGWLLFPAARTRRMTRLIFGYFLTARLSAAPATGKPASSSEAE